MSGAIKTKGYLFCLFRMTVKDGTGRCGKTESRKRAFLLTKVSLKNCWMIGWSDGRI